MNIKEPNSNHKKFSYKYFLNLSVFLLSSLLAQALSPQLVPEKDTLKVGIAGSEPFVFNDGERGIAIEIWEEMANDNSWTFEYQVYDEVDDALNALNKENIDILVGPISITAHRLENFRFSQPFYNSSMSIMSRNDNKTFWDKVKPLFSLKLLYAVGVFLVILAIVGTFFWLAERKASPDQFSKDPVKGIGTGMWLAIVTMSTTGYGDKAPITLAGRILAGSWMIISIIFATSMVAGIASTLILSSLGSTTISTIEELPGRKVGTIHDSPAKEFLLKNKVKTIDSDNLNEAILDLHNKTVDAVVYDRPQLLYYLKNNKSDDDLFISKAEYYKQGYGFAFPTHSTLIFEVNKSLLTLAESQKIEEIILKYIEKDE